MEQRQEGRYRVRFVKAASSRAVDPPGVWKVGAGDEAVLISATGDEPRGRRLLRTLRPRAASARRSFAARAESSCTDPRLIRGQPSRRLLVDGLRHRRRTYLRRLHGRGPRGTTCTRPVSRRVVRQSFASLRPSWSSFQSLKTSPRRSRGRSDGQGRRVEQEGVPSGVATVLVCQVNGAALVLQAAFCRSMALRMVSSLRMHAVRASFLGFACCEQALIELTNHRVAPGGHKGSHVQHGSDRGAPAPDRSLTSQPAAVVVERSDPHEVVLTVRMFEVSPRASLTHAFADLDCVFGLICRLVRAAIPSKCQSGCVA